MSAATTMGYSTFSDKDLDSCLKQDTSERNNLNLFKQGILREDAIELSMQMMNSQGPGYYQLDNQNGCECGLKEARNIQVSQPGINFKGGCGWSGELGCLTDNDSNLRQNKDRITNKREIHQLTERLSATTRNLTKGFFDVDAESVIRPGDFGKDQKPVHGDVRDHDRELFHPDDSETEGRSPRHEAHYPRGLGIRLGPRRVTDARDGEKRRLSPPMQRKDLQGARQETKGFSSRI